MKGEGVWGLGFGVWGLGCALRFEHFGIFSTLLTACTVLSLSAAAALA